MAVDKDFTLSRLVIVLNALILVCLAGVIFMFFRVYSDGIGKYEVAMAELVFVGHIFILFLLITIVLSVFVLVYLKRSQRKMVEAIEQLRIEARRGTIWEVKSSKVKSSQKQNQHITVRSK